MLRKLYPSKGLQSLDEKASVLETPQLGPRIPRSPSPPLSRSVFPLISDFQEAASLTLWLLFWRSLGFNSADSAHKGVNIWLLAMLPEGEK